MDKMKAFAIVGVWIGIGIAGHGNDYATALALFGGLPVTALILGPRP